MARGLFSGLLWGAVVSIIIAAGASLMGKQLVMLSSVPPQTADINLPETGMPATETSAEDVAEPPAETAPVIETPPASVTETAPAARHDRFSHQI